MVNKKVWKIISRKARICWYLGFAMTVIGVFLMTELRYYTILALSLFIGGLLIGFSGLPEELAEEFERKTGEKWGE